MDFQGGGFPDNSKFTPLPNLMFGSVLEKLNDIDLLKCILRIIFLQNQKKGFPRFLTLNELIVDKTLTSTFWQGEDNHADALVKALGELENLGLILYIKVQDKGGSQIPIYLINSQEGRKGAEFLKNSNQFVDPYYPSVHPRKVQVSKENIFTLYEQNIGVIGHMMAEELKEAERNYPNDWLQEAFREAVLHNKRNWSYIRAILKGWAVDGKGNGESGRYSKKNDSREWIRRHGLPKP